MKIRENRRDFLSLQKILEQCERWRRESATLAARARLTGSHFQAAIWRGRETAYGRVCVLLKRLAKAVARRANTTTKETTP